MALLRKRRALVSKCRALEDCSDLVMEYTARVAECVKQPFL